MDQHELRKQVEGILDSDMVGVMATVRHNKPYARYMTFFHQDLKLYTATNKKTEKVEELEAVPYAHILLGYEGEGFGDEYVEYEGNVTISQSKELKDQLWNEHMKSWFNGPEDPNYVVLEIKPIQINLMNKQGLEPKTLNL